MIWSVIQAIKRFAILVPGLIIAYVSWQAVFPYFDRRVPDVLAIFITYVIGAYLLIPALIRMFRLFVPARHLPLYCVTPDGLASDPLNIGLLGNRQQLIAAMETAGWHLAGSRTPQNLFRQGWSIASGKIFYNAPVSSLYLFGRKQDLAFQIPIEGGRGRRHHVRFWATTYDQAKPLEAGTINWQDRRAGNKDKNLLWVGAASLDTGLGLIRHNAQLTHNVHPDTNQERELIIKTLRRTKKTTLVKNIKLGNPYRLVNRVWRAYLHSDGRMAILKLK